MVRYMLQRKVIEKEITRKLKTHEEIVIGYLYGSFISGKVHTRSDIDVGLLVEESFSPKPLYEAELRAELEDISAVKRDIQVVVLNKKPVMFLHQVLQHAKVLFSRDERKRIQFESLVHQRYIDFKPYIEAYRHMLRRKFGND